MKSRDHPGGSVKLPKPRLTTLLLVLLFLSSMGHGYQYHQTMAATYDLEKAFFMLSIQNAICEKPERSF